MGLLLHPPGVKGRISGKYLPKTDEYQGHDDDETYHAGFGKDFGIIDRSWRRFGGFYLLGAADRAHPYAIAQFSAAFFTNHICHLLKCCFIFPPVSYHERKGLASVHSGICDIMEQKEKEGELLWE